MKAFRWVITGRNSCGEECSAIYNVNREILRDGCTREHVKNSPHVKDFLKTWKLISIEPDNGNIGKSK